jgi:diguanylate cyclase (GGDEF)-like protein
VIANLTFLRDDRGRPLSWLGQFQESAIAKRPSSAFVRWQTVAQALSARLRATDTLGRLGGDEFAVILPHASPTEAKRVAHDLVAAVSGACHGAVTASCGVAIYKPETSATPEQLLAEADRAMYEAKRAGRNTVALGGGIVT